MMKTGPFSLNIDEATSSSLHKVLCILVGRYSPSREKLVVEHLTSISLVKVDSESVFKAIQSFMVDNNIP